MRRVRARAVAALSLTIGLTWGASASAQEGLLAYPPLAVAPAPGAQSTQQAPSTPTPPVFIPGFPVPGVPGVPVVPATPALPTWTPGVPVLPQMPPTPWTGIWMDRHADAFQGASGAYAGQRAGERRTESTDLPFADPSKPGAVVVNLFSGSIRVKAAKRDDVGVRVTHAGRASLLPRKPEPPPAGMRRLTPSPQGAVAGDGDNQIVLRLMNPVAGADLELEVPARTNLNLRVVNGGAIEVEGVEGNLEVNNVNGPIRLQGVAGSVVADAVNGDVTVAMTRVAEQKVMAFSSLNGKIDVTLPRTTKANLRLRSDNGDVFTDFDVAQMAPPPISTSVQPFRPFQWVSPNTTSSVVIDRFDRNGRDRRRIELDGNKTIYGSINGGGPEIEARSFNGSVLIRRGPQ